MNACRDCLRRSWLLQVLSPCLEHSDARGLGVADMLALSDDKLIASLAGVRAAAVQRAYEAFDERAARAAAEAAGLWVICRHDARSPECLEHVEGPCGALHVAGDPQRFEAAFASDCAAIVGSRSPSDYGEENARRLARGLAAAGVPVISGMAMGIDSAAHRGALELGGTTVAVLAGGADVPYPRLERRLHARLSVEGLVISELPPGTSPRRWSFPARNRLIAALAGITVVVEARLRSGSLITSSLARRLGRDVGAVPGRVDWELASGPNALIWDGALLVRDARDILDALLGAGVAGLSATGGPLALEPALASVLDAVTAGVRTAAELAERSSDPVAALAALGELELLGVLRRGPDGRYSPACA